MQIWEAVPLPKYANHIPCNALIATRKGRRVAAIRNADHDGDEFGFSNDPRLLEILDATPEGAGIEEFLQVEAEVKETLPRAPANRLKGVAAFRQFCRSVDTLPVRGIACAMVEKVLHHIFFKSPGATSVRCEMTQRVRSPPGGQKYLYFHPYLGNDPM